MIGQLLLNKFSSVYQNTLITNNFYIHLIMLLFYQQRIQNIFIIFYFYTSYYGDFIHKIRSILIH